MSADGEPVSNTWVSLIDARAAEQVAGVAFGRFEFADIAPGHYWLTVNVGGNHFGPAIMHAGTVSRMDREIDVAAPRTNVDLRLGRAWTVTVRVVTPGGEGLFAAMRRKRVLLFGDLWAAAFATPRPHDLPPSIHAEFRGGSSGFGRERLRSPDKDPRAATVLGQLVVTADAPVTIALLLRRSLLAQQTIEVGQDTVTFTVAPGDVLAKLATVCLRLVDEQGAPVVGARVSLHGAQGLGVHAVTDQNGCIAQELSPGRYGLRYADASLCLPAMQFDIAAGATLDLGDLVPLRSVAVQLAPAGNVGSCSLEASYLGPLPRGCTAMQSPVASTPELYPGRHALVSKTASQWATAIVDTNELPPLPLRLEFRDTVPLRIQTTRADGLWQVDIRTATGQIVHSLELAGAHTLFERMPQGSYEATVTDIDGRRTTRAFTLGPDGSVLTLD